MFRLVLLTFHGERRQPPASSATAGLAHDHVASSHAAPSHPAPSHAAPSHPAPSHPAPSHPAPSHPRTVAPPHHNGLHDAPPAMALVLIVLALGSIVAGYVGMPHALGGSNRLHAWLAPAFTVAPSVAGEAAAAAESAGEAGHTAAADAGEESALELTLMGVSSAIAIFGVGLGWFIWGKRRDLADAMSRQFRGVHRLLLNKYYVDEFYDATVVRPIHAMSQQGLWRGFDVRLIDGAVNGAATVVDAGAEVLRRLQTGSVRTYAGSIVVGVVVILGYYLWR